MTLPLSFARRVGLAVALLVTALPLRAQILELRATINAAQEVPATTSPATGTGVMLYNVATNTFDLFVRLERYANVMTDSHVQEATAGENGSAVIHFGPESVFTRDGSTVTADFLNRPYPGNPTTLLRNGAYLNFHSPQFPRGEIRGQLIVSPKRLVSTFTVAQEQAAFPGSVINSNAYGAAVMLFDPGTNRVSLRLSLFNFTNPLTNSHYHEGAPGISGPVVVGLGAGTASGYTDHGGGHWSGSFDIPYTGGDPFRLLRGEAYLNFHSNVYPGGETRGQVLASEETVGTRLTNLGIRGFIGPGAEPLIGGFAMVGDEPVRVLITAKGPSLAAFGITGRLADPVLSLFDAAGRRIATNDNIGTVAASSELGLIPGVPTNASESALVVVLPPGNYTAVVSGVNGGTGVALLETADLRTLGTRVTN